MFAPRRLRHAFIPTLNQKKSQKDYLSAPKVTAFVAFNARHGLLGPYCCEEVGETATINAAMLS